MKAGLSTKILALGLCAALAVNGNVWSFAAEAVGISKEADENAPATQSEEVVNEGGESSQESTGGESGQTDDGSSDSGQDSENSGSEDGNGGGTEGTEETPSVPEGGDGTGTGDGSDETGDGSGETGDGTETGDGSEETGDGTETGDGSEETGDGTETGDGSEETGDGSETGDGNVSDNNPSDGDENENEDNDGSDVSGNDGQDDEKEDISGNDPSEGVSDNGVSDNGVSDNGVSDNGTLGERRLRMEKELEDGTKVIVYYSETDEALKDSELEVIPITEGEDYDKIAEQIAAAGSDASEFRSYDIYFTKDGEEVEPDEEVEVIFEFPDGGIEVSTGEKETEEAEGLSVTVGDVQPKRMMAANLDENEEDKQQEEKIKVYHFEDGIEQAPVSMESEIEENDGKVTSVSFNTESFSIYVIVTPNRDDNFEIAIKDSEDNPLNIERIEVRLSNRQVVDLTDLAKNETGNWNNLATIDVGEGEDKKTYNFSYATVGSNKREITGICYWNNRVQYGYSRRGDTVWTDLDDNIITFYYVGELEKVTTTIDNEQYGINMTLFDYDGGGKADENRSGIQWKVMGGKNYATGVALNMLSRTFNNGFPEVKASGNNDNNPPFSRLFSGNYGTSGTVGSVEAMEANHLLQYDENTGYFSYSSFENYAYYDKKTKNFILYKALGTPSNSDDYYFQRGNFLPFNDINSGRLSDNENSYDKLGNRLEEEDHNYKAPLYLPEGTINYNFGLHMDAKFSQPRNGEVNGQPMTYEFTGDDDLWIYIDGVLVLDMGGVHDARTGSINFKTGEVKIDLVRDDKNDYPYSTTIRDMFREALGENFNESDFSGDTFANFTNHTIDMFYMERGAGASNLEMKFNLPVIPKNTVVVEKQLKDTDQQKYANVEFEFQMFVQKEDPKNEGEFLENQYVLYTKDEAIKNGVKYKKADGTVSDNLEWRQNEKNEDIFVLKPSEQAEFSGLLANRKYYVVECGVKSDEFDQVEITDTSTIDWSGDGSQTGEKNNAISSKRTVDERPKITFQNRCTAKNLRELWIEKKMAEGQDSGEDVFKIKVELENTSGDLVPYQGKYFVDEKTDPRITGDGVIELRADETAKITDILSETGFRVYEIIEDGSRYDSDYDISIYEDDNFDSGEWNPGGSSDPNDPKAVTGEIVLGKDSKVIVTNSIKGGKLAITKAIDGFAPEEDTTQRIFEFTISQLDAGEQTLEELQKMNLEQLEDMINTELQLSKSILFTEESLLEHNYYVPMDEISTENVSLISRIAGFFKGENADTQSKTTSDEASWLKLPIGFYLIKETPETDGAYTCVKDDWSQSAHHWQVVEIVKGKEQTVNFYNKLQQDDGQLKIIKTVDRVDEVHGDAVFQFEIKKRDTGEIWYRTISFTGDATSSQTKYVLLTDLPYGEYEVKELSTLRYTLEEGFKNPQTVVVGAESKENPVSVSFENEKTFDSNFSHADVIENSFTVKPDGTLDIMQIPVPGETVTE